MLNSESLLKSLSSAPGNHRAEKTLRLSVQILNINNGRLRSHKLAQLSCSKEHPFEASVNIIEKVSEKPKYQKRPAWERASFKAG